VGDRRADATPPAPVTKATRSASLSVAGGFDGRSSDSKTLVMIDAPFFVGVLGEF
jgi:hypothetical protein